MATSASAVNGFWGQVDALHVFCEPKYATSYYFAEFWNSVSSVLYCVAGLYILSKPEARADTVIAATALSVVVIGVGSASFHGSMRWALELCDELPMLVFITCALLCKSACLPPALAHLSSTTFSVCVVLTCLVVTAVYVFFQQYEFFVAAFTLLVAVDLVIGWLQRTTSSSVRFARVMTIVSIVLGKMVWEIEVRLCSSEPRVWVLHVLWHALSCISAYYGILSSLTYRIECGLNPLCQGTDCRLDWRGLPFATIRVMRSGPAGAGVKLKK